MVTIDWFWVKSELLKKERIAKSESESAILAHLDECLEKARGLAKPRIARATKRISAFSDSGIELEGGARIPSKAVSKYIRGAASIELCVLTIGDDIEKEATRLMESNDHLQGYLMDRIGSFAVESLAASFEEGLRNSGIEKGESVSARFSPGYCDWPIEEQFTLAKLIDFSAAGVQLAGSCMMVPKKSISAIVAIGPKGLFSTTGSPCKICNMKECDYRREK